MKILNFFFINLCKYFFFLFISILKKKRFVIITPNLTLIKINKIYIYDKLTKSLFYQNIKNIYNYNTIVEIFYFDYYNINNLKISRDLNLKIINEYSNKKKPLIIDCGANIGSSSVYFHKNFPNSIIISIEPEKENFLLLLENIKNINNIITINSAISSEELFFNVLKSNDNRGHQIKLDNFGNKTITVDSLLKNYCGNSYFPFIIKIDIEGFEDNLFSKNYNWVDMFDVIIIELHDWMMPKKNISSNFIKCLAESTLKKVKRDIVISGENLILIKT